jgi:hypothetical protein
MRITRFAGVVPVAGLLVGCYTLQPTRGGVPDIGTQVTFDVNDAGRVALGGSMGQPIRRVEGQLVGATTDSYVVSVTSVDYLAGGSQKWTGDTVRLQREHVGVAYQRQLSKTRTVAAGAVLAGAIAFFVTRSLNGGGDPDDPNGNPPPTGTTIRGPRP